MQQESINKTTFRSDALKFVNHAFTIFRLQESEKRKVKTFSD